MNIYLLPLTLIAVIFILMRRVFVPTDLWLDLDGDLVDSYELVRLLANDYTYDYFDGDTRR